MKVIVSCSGKFHAFNLVEELQRNGIEVIFFTSYSSKKNYLFKYLAKRIDNENIEKKNIKTNIIVAFGIKIFKKYPQLINNYFDSWVSRQIKKHEADWFIGWSSMSEKSIKIAKSKGIKTILERGSAHIIIQDDLLKRAYYSINKKFEINPQTVNKELVEYENANFISVPSQFCLKTFMQTGFCIDKIFVNNYGVSNYFKPVLESKSSVTTILYLGRLSIQKGIHILLPIIEEFITNKYKFKFIFIGGIDNDIRFLINSKLTESENIKFLGHIDHYYLSHYIGACDVAIIPSIQDGFAMVAPQILKVGIPIIISENAGAEQLIKEGQNGWVVKPEYTAIKERLAWAIFNYKDLLLMRRSILKLNLNDELSWVNYGKRYVKFLNEQL
jgi:glycosyltransferase involved in cell wall biosynthesis